MKRKGWEFAAWTFHSGGEDVVQRGSRISGKLVGLQFRSDLRFSGISSAGA